MQKKAYEMRISDWSSEVCSTDLRPFLGRPFQPVVRVSRQRGGAPRDAQRLPLLCDPRRARHGDRQRGATRRLRSEEHTSELQSLMRISYAVFCLKKKTKIITRPAEHVQNSYTRSSHL